jgi:hypothetical protein
MRQRIGAFLIPGMDFRPTLKLAQVAAAYRWTGVTLPAIRPIGFPDAPHCCPTLQAFAA